jgi:xanthine permease XanP
MQNSNNKVDPALEIVYGLNDKPPPGETMFAAVRHLLAIIVGIMTPPPVLKLLLSASSIAEEC